MATTQVALDRLIRRKTAGPRAVGAGFHHHEHTRITAAQIREAVAMVGDGLLADNPALGIGHTHGVLFVSEVDSNGVGGSFCFHGSGMIPGHSSPGPAAIPSILLRRFLSEGRHTSAPSAAAKEAYNSDSA